MQQERWELDLKLGEEANRLYQSELIQGFFRDLDKSLWEAFKGSLSDDIDGREKVYAMLKLAGRFENCFKQYIAGGKMADDMLKKVEAGAFDNI